jgi:hypothetical protein
MVGNSSFDISSVANLVRWLELLRQGYEMLTLGQVTTYPDDAPHR